MKKAVYIVGDIHGYFSSLIDKIEKADIRDCYLICVGDLGIGFKYTFEGEIQGILQLDQLFAKRNIVFMSIRGNHDDPWYWGIGKDAQTINYNNFKLIKDYTTMDINGEKFLFVGGGISIDRKIRKKGFTYWTDEVFVLDESKVVECDVLITHSGPHWIGPYDKNGISGWCKRDDTLWDDCRKERADHDTLYNLANPKYSYLGHFHFYQVVEHNGCIANLIDELQIVEHKPYEQAEEKENSETGEG